MLGSNGPPLGNGIWRIECSRDWWRHVTQKGQGLDPQYIWGPIIPTMAIDTDLVAMEHYIGNDCLGPTGLDCCHSGLATLPSVGSIP